MTGCFYASSLEPPQRRNRPTWRDSHSLKLPVEMIFLPVTSRKFLATLVSAASGRERFHPEPSLRNQP